jgi:hypothetical protein
VLVAFERIAGPRESLAVRIAGVSETAHACIIVRERPSSASLKLMPMPGLPQRKNSSTPCVAPTRWAMGWSSARAPGSTVGKLTVLRTPSSRFQPMTRGTRAKSPVACQPYHTVRFELPLLVGLKTSVAMTW